MDKKGFAELVVKSWNECCRSKVLQWVVSDEMHHDGGKHFHMAVKLDNRHYGIKLNFSDRHENYFSAYRYVIKDDTEYVMSENHPDLTNATAPRTTNATKKRKATAMKSNGPSKKKKKRLTVYQVVTIIQSKGIKSRLDLMALASKWQEQGKDRPGRIRVKSGSKSCERCPGNRARISHSSKTTGENE